MLANTKRVALCPWARQCDSTYMFLRRREALSQVQPVRHAVGSWMLDNTSWWWTAQRSDSWTENTNNNKQSSEAVLLLVLHKVFRLSENCVARFWVFVVQTCSGERTVMTLLPSAASICSSTETASCSIGPRMLYRRRPGLPMAMLEISLYPEGTTGSETHQPSLIFPHTLYRFSCCTVFITGF